MLIYNFCPSFRPDDRAALLLSEVRAGPVDARDRAESPEAAAAAAPPTAAAAASDPTAPPPPPSPPPPPATAAAAQGSHGGPDQGGQDPGLGAGQPAVPPPPPPGGGGGGRRRRRVSPGPVRPGLWGRILQERLEPEHAADIELAVQETASHLCIHTFLSFFYIYTEETSSC